MHELALVNALITAVTEDASGRGLKKVTFCRIVVGKLNAVSTEVLSFALENLSRGTMLEGACFELHREKASGECADCRHSFVPVPPFFLCPSCGSGKTVLTGGRQVYVDCYEGE